MEVMDLMQEINDEGITIIIVTHEHDIAMRTQRSIKLKDGVIDDIIYHGSKLKAVASY
jgi:putative ABC transport system ATP-binding protein